MADTAAIPGVASLASESGNSFHHSAPDSRHSHTGRKEGHGQWHGQANGITSQGFGGQRQGIAQPRSQERSFGNNAPRRNGDRPSYTLGRGNNGNTR